MDDALVTFGEQRSAVLATIGADARPHLVPVVFAIVDRTIVTAVDHKPKSTRRLQRLINIERNPHVGMLVDHYSEDWDTLWWIRADGIATIHHSGPTFESAVDALVARYSEYRSVRPAGPVICVSELRFSSWSAT